MFDVGHTYFAVNIFKNSSGSSRLCEGGNCYQHLSTDQVEYEVCDRACFPCLGWCYGVADCQQQCPSCFNGQGACINYVWLLFAGLAVALLLVTLLVALCCSKKCWKRVYEEYGNRNVPDPVALRSFSHSSI